MPVPRATVATLFLLAFTARAEVPLPTFPECGEASLDRCPNDLDESDWDQISWIPETSRSTVREAELAIGSGIACDVAFRYATGRFDVPIAILDTGILWDEQSLARKVLLNTAELPYPQDTDGLDHGTHDLDGNGLVNVTDYAWDPRVDATAGVDAADGLLDPSDLIYTFSDGVDDDGNGFPDDIAGWDFWQWDNDPYADMDSDYANHGTGVMEEAAQEGNDGGGIGVCPGCSVLPIRTGDVIITDGDRVALAITYATDRGARVVGMALGALTHSELSDRAIAWADDNDVVLVAAAGDENSYHHNFPAVADPILYVHSVRGDNAQERSGGVYSFLNFFNCNNYGPRLDLIAPSYGCATGATARISGSAGLVISAGLDAGVDLTGDEVRALLRGTADDVWLSDEELAIADTYPSLEGWDAFYGYGRVNVGRAVERVATGELPPVARITSPGWFEWPAGVIRIEGTAAARHSDAVSWTLEAGRGAEPNEWRTLAQGGGPAEGQLALLDPNAVPAIVASDLFGEGVVERMYRAHESMLTVRLTVTDAEGRTATDRRGFFVHADPARLPGFPFRLGGSGEPSPALADLDGDGVFEIVAATGSGEVHALRGDATSLPGFPVRTEPIPRAEGYAASAGFVSGAVPSDIGEGIVVAPAVGDLDGDGAPEIVAAGFHGGVYAWKADGSLMDGFPVRVQGRPVEERVGTFTWDDGVGAAPSLGDVDGDGDLEIVIAAMDQRLYVWDGDGTLLDGYPLELCSPELCGVAGSRILSSPALGDIDADGDLDAALGTNEVPRGAAGLLYLVDLSRAAIWEGFPIPRDGLINTSVLPVIGEGHPSSVSLADLDGDGDLEIASNAMLGSDGILHHDVSEALPLLYVRDGFGASSSVIEENAFVSMITNPAFGDMDGDAVPDVLLGGSGPLFLISLASSTVLEYEHAVGGWSGADGASLPGFPRAIDDVSFLNAPAIADITGDGAPEALYASGGFFVYAWDAQGEIAPGWPRLTGGWTLGGPAVGDVDGDGWLDVVITTREGYLFAWRTEGRADGPVHWAGARHDAANTGNHQTPLAVQAGPRGGCCGGGGARSALLGLLLIPIVSRRRWIRR